MGKDKLTNQDKTFVKEIVETGNKTKAAKKAYGYKDDNVAGVMANKRLRKVKIQNAIKSIADSIPDELLIEKHKVLLDKKELAYFVFSRSLKDTEIKKHMKANGLDLIVIRPSDKGKMAFYSIPDGNAIKAGLDMGYKIKGTYANVKVEFEFSPKKDLKEYD